MMTRRIALILPVLLLLVAVAEAAAPSEDRILALDRYTSDKGRTLGATYAVTLKQINTSIYHCMPWLEVPKEGIGFYKPRDAARDDRYLSLRVYIEQEPSMQFAAMPVEQRASSMFSRYVGPLLRRLSGNGAMLNDSSPDIGISLSHSRMTVKPSSELSFSMAPLPLRRRSSGPT